MNHLNFARYQPCLWNS